MYIYYLSLLFAFSHKFKRNEIMQYTKLIMALYTTSPSTRLRLVDGEVTARGARHYGSLC